MIPSASRLTVSRHQLVSKSSALYMSTRMGIQKQMCMEGFEKSKIKNVRGCEASPIQASEINELKNERIKAFAKFEFKPASKMRDCAISP